MKLTFAKCKRGYNEIITGTSQEIAPYLAAGYKMGFGAMGRGEYQAVKFRANTLTEATKRAARNEWNVSNPAYACCVACGRDLHEHNKGTHFKSEFGIIGPECYKKLFPALAAMQ